MANVMNAKDALSASLAECFVTIEGNRFLELQNTYLHIQISQILCICMTVENSEARSRLRSNSNTGNQPSKSVISTIVIQEYRYISK